MKKRNIIILLILVFVIIYKYYYSNYKIQYNINNYTIQSSYLKNRLYTEIKKDKTIYNFDLYLEKRKKKYLIEEIEEINGEDFKCIYPKINGIDTYPLCKRNEELIDYNLIESDLLTKYKKNNKTIDTQDNKITYNKNLSKNEYIAIWNYKGFYIINDKKIDNISLFEKERYNNDLSYLFNDTLFIADYNSEHTFNKFILLNITNMKKEEFKIKYNINFDSYFVGSIGKYLYIYDNKDSILYEINTKSKEIKIKYNNETGYGKYNGKEFVSCSKSEYKINRITFDIKNSNYIYKYNQGYYKIIKNNKKIQELIFKEKMNIINEDKDTIYYLCKNKLYKYSPFNGSSEIVYYNELEFNDKNMVFVYLNN